MATIFNVGPADKTNLWSVMSVVTDGVAVEQTVALPICAETKGALSQIVGQPGRIALTKPVRGLEILQANGLIAPVDGDVFADKYGRVQYTMVDGKWSFTPGPEVVRESKNAGPVVVLAAAPSVVLSQASALGAI